MGKLLKTEDTGLFLLPEAARSIREKLLKKFVQLLGVTRGSPEFAEIGKAITAVGVLPEAATDMLIDVTGMDLAQAQQLSWSIAGNARALRSGVPVATTSPEGDWWVAGEVLACVKYQDEDDETVVKVVFQAMTGFLAGKIIDFALPVGKYRRAAKEAAGKFIEDRHPRYLAGCAVCVKMSMQKGKLSPRYMGATGAQAKFNRELQKARFTAKKPTCAASCAECWRGRFAKNALDGVLGNICPNALNVYPCERENTDEQQRDEREGDSALAEPGCDAVQAVASVGGEPSGNGVGVPQGSGAVDAGQ